MEQWWLWSYVGFMLGTAMWFVWWCRDPKSVPRIAYWLVIVILLWSGGWHVFMALGGAGRRWRAT